MKGKGVAKEEAGWKQPPSPLLSPGPSIHLGLAAGPSLPTDGRTDGVPKDASAGLRAWLCPATFGAEKQNASQKFF